jgi:pimeloyl-ACP methyl ester carboxylesterase
MELRGRNHSRTDSLIWTTAVVLLVIATLMSSSSIDVVVVSAYNQPRQQRQPQRPQQSIATTPVVICPGFGNDQIDYYEPLQQPRDVGMVAALERRGFDPALIYTLPIQRSDWFKVAGGLLDWNFYTNAALPTGKGYGWYVQRFRDTIQEAHFQSGGQRVLVIGHSAGGWLARASMGDGTWSTSSTTTMTTKNPSATPPLRVADLICGLVTVGAIHKPPVTVTSCVTRGALAYTDQTYPGAFLKHQGIAYVSVGGDAVVGNNAKPSRTTTINGDVETSTAANRVYAQRGEGSEARVAYTSYEAVCGRGNVTGDGVVPLEWTQLEGATQLQLAGVMHSINIAGTTLPSTTWYGAERVLDQWLPVALQEAGISTQPASSLSFDLKSLQQWAAGVFNHNNNNDDNSIAKLAKL